MKKASTILLAAAVSLVATLLTMADEPNDPRLGWKGDKKKADNTVRLLPVSAYAAGTPITSARAVARVAITALTPMPVTSRSWWKRFSYQRSVTALGGTSKTTEGLNE